VDLFPAIDLRGGRCVRLLQGDYGRETVYDDDPAEVAERFAAAGCRWLHVVDLDAARSGDLANTAVVRDIVAAAGPAAVQCGGGVRDRARAEALFSAGVRRVVLGTAAVEDPTLVRDLAADHDVAVGVDARDGRVAVRGWTAEPGIDVGELLARYEDAGVAAVVVTDIGRDGMKQGPDREGLRQCLGATTVPVVASGGVGRLDDLRALAALATGGRRLAGAIVGKALYDGHFTAEEAVAACRP